MDSLEYAGEWQPATPEHRPVKRLDAYGFEIREEFAELYDQFEPSWAEEEEERTARWAAFLADLRQQSSRPVASDEDLLLKALDSWQEQQDSPSDYPSTSIPGLRLGTLLRRPGEYAALVARALADAPALSPDDGVWPGRAYGVDKDLHRTFPGHAAMDAGGRRSLRRVLAAYAARNPAVGYCQGLNFVAAAFLLFLPEEGAFWCLAAVVERVLPGYFDAAMEVPALDARILAHLVQGAHPATARHLDALEVDLGSVTLHWFLCIFVNSLPLETCLRVWDLLFLEGSPVVLFRTALALVDIYNQAICATRESSDAYMMLQALAPMSLDGSRLIDTAAIAFRTIRHSALGVLRAKYRRELALQPGPDPDAGHHISWGEECGSVRVVTPRTRSGDGGVGRGVSGGEGAGAGSGTDAGADHGIANCTPGAACDPLDFRSPVRLPRPRRRTVSAAAVLEGPARHLRAFLQDRRRPGVAAALEAARPSPAAGLVRTPPAWALARGAPRGGEESTVEGVQPRALCFGERDGGGAAPRRALEASVQLLRRHTVACEVYLEGPGAERAGEDAAGEGALLAALELQLAKVSEVKATREGVLAELRARCDSIAGWLETLEGETWVAQAAVETAGRSLEAKRAALSGTDRRLTRLMVEAERRRLVSGVEEKAERQAGVHRTEGATIPAA
ncbi:TBC1 domain family member 2A [Auxenochlorella protothecoides]|uniref:TBC1 domain family member 2A n=1 Tax=Auxenochlorella protothecoides TaxID=3075 RepID=A0A087SR61_AUXPR|nr:TBC1 domain family member 2A [Auxenochlorella protothecoides]KFM28215.1 TBC1 domain family member 2A [Auxenochlorella protothecoides]